MASTNPPKLVHVFNLRGNMGHGTITAGHYQSGLHRHITSLDSGFLRGVPGSRGEKMNATLVSGGSDWILFDENSRTAHLDVRTQGRNPAGDGVYIHYTGALRMDEATEKFMKWSSDAQTTDFGEHLWWIGPIIDAGWPRRSRRPVRRRPLGQC